MVLPFAAGYLTMIMFLQHLMRFRPRYEVRSLLAAWNVALATFSLIGVVRTLPEFMRALQNGIYFSVCDPREVEVRKKSHMIEGPLKFRPKLSRQHFGKDN